MDNFSNLGQEVEKFFDEHCTQKQLQGFLKQIDNTQRDATYLLLMEGTKEGIIHATNEFYNTQSENGESVEAKLVRELHSGTARKLFAGHIIGSVCSNYESEPAKMICGETLEKYANEISDCYAQFKNESFTEALLRGFSGK